jgi:hypothetical protein
MSPSPLAATTPRHTSTEAPQPSRRADRVYQGLTIAVMLLLLASLMMVW